MTDVRLRPLRGDDLPLLHRWYQTPELWEHLLGELTPRAQADAVSYMQRWLEPSDTEVRLGIETSDGEFVGLVFLSPIDPAARTAEFHILLGEPAARGRGYGAAATAAMLEHGFSVLGLERIELRVLADNAAARRTYDRCGFRGKARTRMTKAGRFVEVLEMDVDSKTWADAWRAQPPRSATT